MSHPKYSVIVPVYNRPDEVRELLESLDAQTQKDFEVILVEDGSTETCEAVTSAYAEKLPIRYCYKPNAGPGPARNFGYAQAAGDYLVAFDSDCILPPTYFEAVDRHLATDLLDAWGGPDRGHEKFTVPQRAMAYTMSSFLTTGGIRGGKKRLGWFQPRSFNMGMSRQVFEVTGGFRFDRFAEDIELSIRIRKSGFRTGLIPEAFVFHKRRASFYEFFKQVVNFGKGRALVGKVHPEEVRLTHWFPAVFTTGCLALLFLALADGFLFTLALAFFLFYLCLIFCDSLYVSRHLGVAVFAVFSALLQLWGYGSGFLMEKFRRKSH